MFRFNTANILHKYMQVYIFLMCNVAFFIIVACNICQLLRINWQCKLIYVFVVLADLRFNDYSQGNLKNQNF